jgi:K+-sensing histidine kinase KdpD
MKGSYKLLTGMSHEMRSHMNSIVGFSSLMERNCQQNSENREYNNLILNSCNRLISLFQNYLDSAMLETVNSQVKPMKCSIGSIVENSFSEFREIMALENKNGIVLLSEEYLNDRSEILIDYSKVNRILLCLFQNALNNTKSGYIKLGYYLSDRNVTFYILDTGQDYSQSREFLYTNDMDKSLTKYFDTTTAINIILAKKSVQVLGGKIWIDSNEVIGTGVYFSVPYKEVEPPENLCVRILKKQSVQHEIQLQLIEEFK